jgi:hypothetical protein
MPNAFEEYTSVLKGGTAPTSGSGGGSSFNSYISGAGVKAVKPQQSQPSSITPISPVSNNQNIIQKISSGIKTFGQNVSKEGLGGAIADIIIPKSKQQSQEVINQNLKTFIDFQTVNRPEALVTQMGLEIVKDKTKQFGAAGTATSGLINKNIFGTYNLTSQEQNLLKERGYLDDKGNIKLGKTAVETAKNIGDLAIFFPQVFAPVEFVSQVASGGKVIRVAGQSVALSRIIEGAVIGGSYNTLYTPKLEDIFSDKRIAGDAAKNFLIGSAIGIAISIPVELIRNPGTALSTDVKSIKGTSEAYKALPPEQQIELKRVYLNLAKKYHPDSLVSGNETAFKEIVDRYNKADLIWLEKLDKASAEEVAKILNIPEIKPTVPTSPTASTTTTGAGLTKPVSGKVTTPSEKVTPPKTVGIPAVIPNISNIPKSIIENATKFRTVEDFADSVGAKPTDQVGKMIPSEIIARDPVDEKFVAQLVERINAGETLEPIVLEKSSKDQLQTFNGSNRLTAYQQTGKPIDVIYPGKGKIEGLVTLEDVFKRLNKPGITKTGIKTPKTTKTQNKGIVGPKTIKSNKVSEEFKVGDILDPQGNTNMVGKVTIREISGNTLKFVDSKGTEYAGMQRSVVRDLVKGGSWKKIQPKEPVKKTPTKVKKSVKKLTVKEQEAQIKKEALMESNPMLTPAVEQYSDVITKAIRIYNLTKAKGNEDIATITKKVPDLDSAIEALRSVGYEVNTMDELVSLKKRSRGVSEDLGFNPKNIRDIDSPTFTQESQKLIRRSEIAKELSKKLDVPIRTGKFRSAGALGIFKPDEKVVRLKGGGRSGGMPTLFHEVGHYIDSNLNLSKDINITERRALMKEYGYSYANQPHKQKKEAFAEFLRFRMTGQEEKATKLAPEFSKVFDEKMKSLPEIKDVLDTAKRDYQRWKEQPASAKVLSQISIGKQPGEGIKDIVSHGLHTLYTDFVDDLHPLSQFSGLAKKRGLKISAEKDPYILARTMRGWAGIADLFLNKGTFDPTNYYKLEGKKPKMIFTGKSLSEILKPIATAKAEDDFRVFLTSKRVVEDLAPRDIQTGIATEDAEKAIEEVKARHPNIDFEAIGKEIITYQDALLKYASSPNKGLLGPEGLKKIKALNKYHIPFYRVMEELRAAGYMGNKKFAGNMGNPIKRIKGSEREIIDPLESLIKDTYAIINSSERNSIGVAMANLARQDFELGRLFEKVVSPMKPTTVTGEEIVKGLAEKIGMGGMEDASKEALDELALTIFRPVQDRGQNMLNVNMGDKKLVFQVEPELFKSIQGLNNEDMNLLIRILSIQAKMLRAGATLSPDFSVRNPIRDTFSATIFSNYGFKPGVDLVRGVFTLLDPSGDVYNLWKAGGGESAMFVSLDRDKLQQTYKDLVASKGAKALNLLKNPIDLLRASSEIGEEATRVGEMLRALQSGASPKESAFASREVTLDFGRIGAKGRAINSIKAFFNSGIQGTDKMIRSFKDHPFRTLLKALLYLTIPSILLYMANRKDKRWKEIPQWQKDLFWIILTPNHIYRVPKPFETGILFASVPERVLEYMDTKNPDKLNALMETVLTGMLPDMTPIPTAGIPLVENMTNYSFFLKRPIVSQGQENLPPEAQFGAYTSETAKLIGKALGYSPAKVDNLIQGYTGGLGNYTTQAVDVILKGTGIATPVPAPAKGFEDMPVIRAFTIRPPIGSSSESVNSVYTKYGKISTEMTYVTKLAKGGEEQKAIDYIKKHPEVVNAPLLNDTISTFSAINKKIDEVRKDKSLNPREKKDLIDKLGQAQTDLAENVLEQLKSE